MGVISVRIPDDLQKELEAGHVKVAEVVRRDLSRLAARLRAKRKMELLETYRTPADRPVVDMVRDAREEH